MDESQANEVKLTRGEYWILSAVVAHWMPLGRLTLPDFEEAWNVRRHGLSDEEVASTVERLVGRGLLRIQVREHEVSLDAAALRAALQERIDLAAKTGYRTCFGLTAAGAAVWEAFARPDWSRFVDDSWVSDESSGDREWELIITCVTERVLRGFCEAMAAWRRLDPAAFAFEAIGAWDATYWKTLPSGHRARLAASPHTMDIRDPTAGTAVAWLRRHWCNDWPVS